MIECPAGTLWDENLNICNHAYQVSCNNEPIRNMKVKKPKEPAKPSRPAKAIDTSKSNSVSDQVIKPNSIDDRNKVPLSTPVTTPISTTETTTTTETTRKLSLDLPLCTSSDESTIDLRSGEEYIPFETCLPACPPETESSIDQRGGGELIPGIDCIVVKKKEIVLPLLPLCPSDDQSSVEYLDYSEKYIPFETCLPACPPESDIDIRGARNLIPGVNCLDGPMTTNILPTVVPDKPLILSLCPSEEGSSINLKSGEDYIHFETCLPACSSGSSFSIDLRGADDLIPGTDCIPLCPSEERSSIDLRSGEELIPFETCLPACPLESDSIFGVDDSIPRLDCIVIEEKERLWENKVQVSDSRELPLCPSDAESSINLRSEDLIPGINCIVVESKKDALPLCPSDGGCIEIEAEVEVETESGSPYKLSLCPLEAESSIDLRTGDGNIPNETCLPACLTESDSMINLRGADDLIPGIDCILLCPSKEGSSIDLRSGEELIPFETCLPACPSESDSIFGFNDLIPGLNCIVIEEKERVLEMEVFVSNDMGLPPCPSDDESPINLRSEDLIPGINCKVVESKKEALPLCPSDDGSSINLRSGEEYIPYETCLPACPAKSDSTLDVRGAKELIPGIDCLEVKDEIEIESGSPNFSSRKPYKLSLCQLEEESSIDLRIGDENIPHETCLPACLTASDSMFDLKGKENSIPGTDCIPVCPSEEGSSINLRSGEELIPFETCLPACPTESYSLVDLRSAKDLIPGVDCIVVEAKKEALPLCPSDDDGSPINLRSSGEFIPYETCLPACPVESNSQVDLRGAEDLIPGVDCIVVQAKIEALPLCPSDDNGSTINLRSSGEFIPYETCLPACPGESNYQVDLRGAEDLIPGVDCIVVEPKKEDLPLCPSDDGSTIDLRTGDELIPFETCLPACPTVRDSLPDVRGNEKLIPGVSCKEVRT